MTLRIAPLSDALGAEVTGVDWTRLPGGDALQAIKAAFLEHHLLCLRSEPLTPAQFARAARCFGEAQVQLIRGERQDDSPEVSRLETTYAAPEDKPGDMAKARLSGWHTDDSYFAAPAKATLLQALALPESGGETRFANARAAYDDLMDDMKARLEDLRAMHCYDTPRAAAPPVPLTAREQAETRDAVHPLVRRHDETGRKALYFNRNRTDRILGMARRDSEALLDRIHAHMTQAKYQYHHPWRLGDILLWDNRCLIHSVNMDFPVGQRRLHQRILLAGPRADLEDFRRRGPLRRLGI